MLSFVRLCSVNVFIVLSLYVSNPFLPLFFRGKDMFLDSGSIFGVPLFLVTKS